MDYPSWESNSVGTLTPTLIAVQRFPLGFGKPLGNWMVLFTLLAFVNNGQFDFIFFLSFLLSFFFHPEDVL